MGKRTTTRHKEDNTFRFQTFEEKLRQISVNVNLSIRDGRAEELGEKDTYFSLEAEKWVDLNRTETFADLLCKIGTDCRSLAQILLQKDRLAKVLLEHLECAGNVASFEPAFALTIALARDLGEEFYPHFQDFVKVIIKIVMESKNTNIIEAGFKCYAYLSKYLRRQIIKDLQQHMKMFSCFMNPKLKTYVMIFACEAFSIVAGKFARDHPEKFLKLLFGVFLRKHPEHVIGVATLLFAIFKGVAGTLKLEGPGMKLKDCFTFLYSLENSDELDVWSQVLSHLSLRLLNHGNAANSEKMIALVESIIVQNLDENREVIRLLSVYASMVEFNNAGKITNVQNCSKLLQQVLERRNSVNNQLLCKIIIELIEHKCSGADSEALNVLQPVINGLLENPDLTYEMLETLDKVLRGFRAYFRLFLEPVMQAYNRTTNPTYVTESRNISVHCLSEAILEQGGLFQLPNSADHYFTGINCPMYYFQNQKRVITVLNANNIKGASWECCSLLEEAENDISAEITDNESTYNIRLLLVFSRLNSKNCERCTHSCANILRQLVKPDELTEGALPVINYLFQVFTAQTSSNASFYEHIPVKELLNHLSKSSTGATFSDSFCLWSLKVLDTVVHFLKLAANEKYDEVLREFVSQHWNALAENLMSGFRMVRALTSSVLRNTVSLLDNSSDKTIEMLDKFLELEDMSLTNTKYSSLAKSILTECKVIAGSDNYDVDLKLLVLKYTLGLLYTNYNLIWSPCIEAIRQAGKHIDMSKYWTVFGSHFCRNQSYRDIPSCNGCIRTRILPAIEEDSTNLLTVATFGLPKSDSGYTGPEEQPDIMRYKVNLWLSLKGQPLTRKEYGDIKHFVDAIISGTKDVGKDEAQSSSLREQSKMIVPVLQFLEGCDLVNVNHDLWEEALKYLTYAPDVQKAAWKFLFAKRKSKLKNYKEDIDEILNSDSMDPFHKFRVDAIDVSLSKQYENETLERRELLMDILIRILIGKERVMKGEKRLQVLRFLAGCTEADAKKYLSLTVGSAKEVQQLPPKIIEIKINKMTSALRVWRYKFPSILDQIVNSACDLASAVDSSVKPVSRRSPNPDEEIPEEVFEEQKRAALKAGRLCIVSFFSSLPRLDMKPETINRIFEVFIWPALNDITVTSVGSVSWILKLFLVWSTHQRFHVLLSKCKDGDVQKSPMWRMFDLLESKSAVFEVKKYILGIIFNLMDPPEVPEDMDEPEESYLNCSNSPLNVTGTFNFETSESVGINIVLLRKDVILNLFQDVQIFKKFTTQTGGGKCLSLISLLAGFATGGETNEKLCSVIIDTFAMCKNNEENLYNSIIAVGKLLSSVNEPLNLIMKLAPNYSWICGRRLRSALVEALNVVKESVIYDIISGMNAWADMAEDTPNFSKRQESYEKAENFLKNGEFDLLSYTLIFYNAIYCISKEEDIGIRNASKNLLVLMATCLKTKNLVNVPSSKTDLHKLLDSIILPKLRSRVQEKDDKRYEDILRVLYAFITSCSEFHGTLKELGRVLSESIIDSMCDIQVHLRTRAMNRLCNKVKEMGDPISPAVLQAYILPIATHYLFDEDRLSKNYNELIDSSIEVLRAVMSVTSHEQYFSYLAKLLDDTKKKTRLAKQFERVLIAIIDAFHFDLSLACPEESKPDDPQEEGKSKEPEIENGTSEKSHLNSDSSEDESQKEEFNIPGRCTHLTMSLLPQTAAIRCLGTLKTSIIPKLRKFLNFEETATHKLAKSSKTVDDDVILKIPCTIALVKLLKKIPRSEGQNGIRSIIPSITAGLRNELVSTRNTLRKTLLNVLKELGTSHLRVVIGYLKSSLQRGYQRHVLNYTVAYLLRCLENELRSKPSDVPIKEVLPLCEDELYGVMQEEKELAAIKQKTREASKSNACPILKVCAKFVSDKEQLNMLIDPAVKHLTEKKSLKVAKASRQWLTSVSEGLADNKAVGCHELLEWLLEVLKKDGMQEDEAMKQNESNEDQPLRKKQRLLETPTDSRIIPTLKKKTVSEGKVGGQSLLTEFTFSCLYTGLNKNGRFRERLTDNKALSLLDLFIPVLNNGIKAPSKQVNVVALRCTTLLLEYELANFKKSEIIDKLQRNGFIAMSNHCYRNTTDSEITNATFKFLSAFFARFPDFKIVLQDFELMLKCVQGYLTDGNCSSSALTLLKGVLHNKYRSLALVDLMQEVFKQCITSYYQHINEGCRQVYLTYLNNYLTDPKDLYLEVQLILRQLDYEHESGRLTATEILNSLLQNIPQDCLEEIKELVFFKVLATLDKEKSKKVRECLGETMKILFKLEKGKSLVKILLKLLVLDKHIPELDTFFLIIGVVIDDPKIFSNEDVGVIIRRIKDVLDPNSMSGMCANNSRISLQIKDYITLQASSSFKNALNRNVANAPLWSVSSPLVEETSQIFELLRDKYLLYEHEWVTVRAIDILSFVLNKLQLTEEEAKSSVAKSIELGKPVCVFLACKDDVQQLIKKIWEAMRSSEREDVLAKGAYALVLLISVAARFSDKSIFSDAITLIRNSVNSEVVKTPRITTIRSVALGCFRGIAKTCPRDAIEQVVEPMTRVAVRELTDDNVPQDVKNGSEKLITVLRDLIGNSAFNVIHAKVNDFLHKKRNLNRAKKKENAVLHPGLVRKRPKKGNLNFKGNKKRKMR